MRIVILGASTGRRRGGAGNASLTTGRIVVMEMRCDESDTSVRSVLDLHVEGPVVQEGDRTKTKKQS